MELEKNIPDPSTAQSVVTATSPILPEILHLETPESERPTESQSVLQVTAFWGNEVLDEALMAKKGPVRIGARGQKADLTVDTEIPLEGNVVAVNQGGQATVHVPGGSQVALRRADGSVDESVNPGSISMGLEERVVFKHNTQTYRVQFVRGNAVLGKGGLLDWYFPRVLTIVLMLHVFLVVMFRITPERNRSLLDELLNNDGVFAQMILKAPEEEKKQKKLDLSGAKGAKAKDDEGKFGKEDKPKEDKLASKAGAPRVDPNKREKDRKIAMNAGLLGMLKGSDSSVSDVFGPGGLGSGVNNAMGGLRGAEMGDAGGAGGLGTRGTGAGGGGSSLGIGGLGTHGHGRGSGGYGNIDLGGRGKGRTRIVPGRTIIKGSLAKAEIARVIRRNLARFKYCYEKQLSSNPNLGGKIAIYFTIAPTGTVPKASVRETTMNDKTVESCTVSVMKSLKFPKPKGGGIVVVTYPFVFAST